MQMIETLIVKVQNHPMCLEFKVDKQHYLVVYPKGMVYDGVGVTKSIGLIKALETLITMMDRHWDESGI